MQHEISFNSRAFKYRKDCKIIITLKLQARWFINDVASLLFTTGRNLFTPQLLFLF